MTNLSVGNPIPSNTEPGQNSLDLYVELKKVDCGDDSITNEILTNYKKFKETIGKVLDFSADFAVQADHIDDVINWLATPVSVVKAQRYFGWLIHQCQNMEGDARTLMDSFASIKDGLRLLEEKVKKYIIKTSQEETNIRSSFWASMMAMVERVVELVTGKPYYTALSREVAVKKNNIDSAEDIKSSISTIRDKISSDEVFWCHTSAKLKKFLIRHYRRHKFGAA
ncbi:hypothetical protein BC938DRAFT_482134 [Jimgerdemannia flammicorona]|uniref:Uncharacterized protein n=1 Tax=Jimgerdemannia flammicorona TaxID=994334 RepID=A0A433QEG8_9FUNG|nr:hypothetical protein BC938DRAFT_482134 [Jimgerdemannia flammicorona]